MVKVRAYLNLAGMDIQRRPDDRSYYILIVVDGVEVPQLLQLEAGRFFISLNETDAHVPKELRSRVVSVTSRDTVHAVTDQKRLLVAGTYVTESRKGHAEIREELIDQMIGRIVDIRCNSLACWKQFRPVVLSGRARQTHSYVPKKPPPQPKADER